MNVIFHTLASVATTAVLSAQLKEKPLTSTAGFTVLGVGFATGVLLHGLLDWSPHQYPLAAAVDIVVSLILFAVVFLLAYHEARWILFACFLGAISPDLVDLGPAILNKQMQWNLPTVKIFPWHWKQYSGSIYDAAGNGYHS